MDPVSIERKVKQAAARYSAIITNEATTVEALVEGDVVALKVPGSRGIVRVPVVDWDGFRALVVGISQAVEEKLTIEGTGVPLPWESKEAPYVAAPEYITVPTQEYLDQQAAAQVGVVRDAATGLPIVAAKPYGLDDPDDVIVPDPIPGVPRVSA